MLLPDSPFNKIVDWHAKILTKKTHFGTGAFL